MYALHSIFYKYMIKYICLNMKKTYLLINEKVSIFLKKLKFTKVRENVYKVIRFNGRYKFLSTTLLKGYPEFDLVN